MGSFIFLGSTGVGKSQLAKDLAKTLFGRDNAIVKLDMSEYMERHSVSKLIGSPLDMLALTRVAGLLNKFAASPTVCFFLTK